MYNFKPMAQYGIPLSRKARPETADEDTTLNSRQFDQRPFALRLHLTDREPIPLLGSPRWNIIHMQCIWLIFKSWLLIH